MSDASQYPAQKANALLKVNADAHFSERDVIERAGHST